MSTSNDTTQKHYYLGLDGGGSKTLAVVVDAQGKECGRGLAGSSNYHSVGLQQAVQNVFAAVEQAIQKANCRLPLHKVWLGIAGVDSPDDYASLSPYLRELAQVVHLTNDAELALSALEHVIGVALIAGTGSIALGRDQYGNTARAGGWGFILGDEGSGYEIGRISLQTAVRAADGRGPQTTLLERFLRYWKLDNASEIIRQVYRDQDKVRIAQLSQLVFSAAREGDQVANDIIQRAADELALAALTVSRKLHFAEQALPLALAGGLLIHETKLRNLVVERIYEHQAVEPIIIVEQPALSAALAAIYLD